MNLTRVYCRCNSGHYFTGESCPYDGWSSSASRELAKAAARLAELGVMPSVEELRKAGVTNATLWRTLIVTFGTGASVFDSLAPESYVVNGETKTPLALGPGYK
jgi:hypothetical protein